VLGHADAGRVAVAFEPVGLPAVADAWQRQADGAGPRLVLVP
jgi:hypothetical protein